MGTACALRLLQAGYAVTLLEKSLPGAESSAAAAGILGAQSEVSSAGPFLELCVASRALFRDFAAELRDLSRVDISYEDSGVLEVALDPAEGRLAAGRAEWMLDRGLNVEILDRDEARKLEPALSESIVGANFYADDHQVDPIRLAQALAGAVAHLGGVFLSGERVVSLLTEGERAVGVRTQNGDHLAEVVVVAGGAWSAQIAGLPPLRTQVKPMAGQIIQVETRPPVCQRVIYGYKGYIVPRADGRVLMGSTLEDRGFDKAVTTEGLQRVTGMALEMAPGLAKSRFVQAWSGLRPATADGQPVLGAGPLDGLFFATGHYRNGILMTPITAQIIADLAQGRAPALDIAPFAPQPLVDAES
ncbi:putative glycine oxidase ThiO [Magnetofaba australis IT-1]|uniref:Putative glycine oxidase ThiO n=2 Tax=Magnetofaba TaxID=1472292 RepID=A0A1Y2K792_9PROT|nr:putative glycine oxidase ThiO [Magnetofaba australis IT-1]